MRTKKAFAVAIEAMTMQKRPIAFDANLHDLFGSKSPSHVNASKKRKELNEAISILQILSMQEKP